MSYTKATAKTASAKDHYKELKQHKGFDAIIAHDQQIPYIYSSLTALGMAPGKNVSVISFNRTLVSDAVYPACSGLYMDEFIIGKKTVDMVNKTLNNCDSESELVTYSYFEGGTL